MEPQDPDVELMPPEIKALAGLTFGTITSGGKKTGSLAAVCMEHLVSLKCRINAECRSQT